MLGSLDGYYLTDDADTHVAIFGPTDSGKDVSHVIPTAHLDRDSSMLIFDPKGGATYRMTAQYRQACSDVVVFAPLQSAQHQPERAGHRAGIFGMPRRSPLGHMAPGANGAGNRHVAALSRAGGGAPRPAGILHVLETSTRRSMAGVLDFFTVAHDTLEDCLEEMIQTTHSDPGTAPAHRLHGAGDSEGERSGAVRACGPR